MSGTQELQKVLDLFEQRIAAVESKVGVSAPPPPPATSSGEAPQVTAFDAYCTKSLEPFVQACASLNAKRGDAMRGTRQAGLERHARIYRGRLCKQEARQFSRRLYGVNKTLPGGHAGASKAISRGDWELHQKTVRKACSAFNGSLPVQARRT